MKYNYPIGFRGCTNKVPTFKFNYLKVFLRNKSYFSAFWFKA